MGKCPSSSIKTSPEEGAERRHGKLWFPTLQRGSAFGDAPRHKSGPRCLFKAVPRHACAAPIPHVP
ncbi:DUF1534 domain-containing protein [Pseudomonas caricapapayae]|nr:DUF1534 domain-containing protein [Pseudomonas caricapapayae]